MSDVPGRPDSASHIRPGWVKVFGIVALILVLLVVALLLFGPESFGPGGGHGPGRH